MEKEFWTKRFLNEDYLCGKGRMSLMENIPFGLDDYYGALRSLAEKSQRKDTASSGSFTVENELTIMNRYGQFGSINTKPIINHLERR